MDKTYLGVSVGGWRCADDADDEVLVQILSQAATGEET